MALPTSVRGLAEDPLLATRLDALCDEGRALAQRFEKDVRSHGFHPFKPAEYEDVLATLLDVRREGLRFLEWGSGTGVITIMADLLGLDAVGIELDASLVETARDLAERHDSRARFVAGSFLPAGYAWSGPSGERHLGTLGAGTPGYDELACELDAFDVVYGYPWPGEAPVMTDVMQRHGKPGAQLLLHGFYGGVDVQRVGAR